MALPIRIAAVIFFFINNTEPPNVRMGKQALEAAGHLNHAAVVGHGLGDIPGKIPILLHNKVTSECENGSAGP